MGLLWGRKKGQHHFVMGHAHAFAHSDKVVGPFGKLGRGPWARGLILPNTLGTSTGLDPAKTAAGEHLLELGLGRKTSSGNVAIEKSPVKHALRVEYVAHVPFGNILDAGHIDVIEVAMQTQNVHFFFE